MRAGLWENAYGSMMDPSNAIAVKMLFVHTCSTLEYFCCFPPFFAVCPVALLLDGRAGEIDCPDEIGVVLEEPIIVEAHDVVVAFLGVLLKRNVLRARAAAQHLSTEIKLGQVARGSWRADIHIERVADERSVTPKINLFV